MHACTGVETQVVTVLGVRFCIEDIVGSYCVWSCGNVSVAASDEHRLSMDGQSKQYITINVISLNSNFSSFGQYSRLSAFQITIWGEGAV